MRRSSIVAPLILIGIGALFLAHNLYPELPLLDYLARYWPFVLIVWGALRLGEVVFWASSGRGLPRFGVSPGEWVLAIFLCIFGSSLHAVRGWNSWWPHSGAMIGGLEMFGENYEFPLSGEKNSSKTPRVVIEIFRGNARVTGADTDAVKVTGHRTIRSLDQNGADTANQEARFEITGDENDIHIRNNQERVSNGRVRLTADMDISVPKGASIEAHGLNGDFDISSINGTVDITSDNAGVRLQDIAGETRIDLRRSDMVRAAGVKGAFELKGRGSDIELQDMAAPVTISGAYSGVLDFRNLEKGLHFQGETTTLTLERLPGELHMTRGDIAASNAVGPVTLSTRSHDVQMTNFTNAMDISVDRGDITLRPVELPLARIEARTRSGNIDLALPANAKFDLSATTAHGEASNDFGAPLRADDQGRGGSVKGSNGGPTVTLHSDHGDVTVRKSTGEESKQDTKSLKKIEQ